jgi:hypothetical protein
LLVGEEALMGYATIHIDTANLVLVKDSIFPVTGSNFVLNFVKASVGLSVYTDRLQIFCVYGLC